MESAELPKAPCVLARVTHSNTRRTGRADVQPLGSARGLGAGQRGARSLVAAELEEAPEMGMRAQEKLGETSSPYRAPRAASRTQVGGESSLGLAV